MRSRDEVIWDFVHNRLRTAENHLHVAEGLLEAQGWYGDAVAFHSQRAAETFMKAWLVRQQIEFLKTHDIAALRMLIAQGDKTLADHLAFADWLTPLGSEPKDPGHFSELARETTEKALADAKRVRDLVLDSLREYLSAGRPGRLFVESGVAL